MENIENIENINEEQAYKIRLLIEYKNLVTKIEKLNYFIENKAKKEGKYYELLCKQLRIMCEYEDILFARICLEMGEE